MCIESRGSCCTRGSKKLFLLMSVLSETLLTLVRSHFVLLSFLSAWHSNVLKYPSADELVEQ
jgi:hypothetical protein